MADDGQVSDSGRLIARPLSGRAGYALLLSLGEAIQAYSRVSNFRSLPPLPLCRIAVHAMLFPIRWRHCRRRDAATRALGRRRDREGLRSDLKAQGVSGGEISGQRGGARVGRSSL
jgi:hypothetical protein